MNDGLVFPSLSQRRFAVVADPFPVVRGAVAALLRHSGAVDEVTEAADADSAFAAVRRSMADMVVTDVDLGVPADGVRLCAGAKRLARPPSVLMFSGTGDPATVARCMTAGADGFVHRSALPERLVAAVESLAAGRSVWYLGETAAERAPHPAAEPEEVVVPRYGMTAREQQILGLLMGRYSNDEIAAELHLARQTVKNHVSNVLHKLGVASRRELLASGHVARAARACAPKETSAVTPKRNSPADPVRLISR